jgi:CheY-like chemotaxis protein
MNILRPAILHVEDDPNDVLLVQRAIRKGNLAVTIEAVQDGDTALAYLQGEGRFSNRELHSLPALVLLDLKIPRRSGLEVLAWIRCHPQFKRVPVVIFTSSRHEKDINDACDMGANSYLVKPVGFDAVRDLLRIVTNYWLSLNERPHL